VNGETLSSGLTAPHRLQFAVPAGAGRITFRAVAATGESQPVAVHVRPDPGTNLRGRVIDSEGRPVAGARVLLAHHGLRADYFDFDEPLNRVPNLTNVAAKLSRAVSAPLMRNPGAVFGPDPLGVGLRPDFAVRYRGWFIASLEGEFRFDVRAQAGALLAINGTTVAVIDGEGTGTGRIALKAGAATLELIHYDNIGASEIEIVVTPPGGVSASLPRSALWSEEPTGAVTDENGEFTVVNVPLGLQRIRLAAVAETPSGTFAGASEEIELSRTSRERVPITVRRRD
jgi:hypothetical protein